MRKTAAAASLAHWFPGAARAQTNEQLKQALDQGAEVDRRAQGPVQQLGSERDKAKRRRRRPQARHAAAGAAGPRRPVQWRAGRLGATRADDATTPDADKARLEIYGQVMLDTIYDFKRMNPQWNATERPSQIPVVCPGSPGCGQDGAWIFSARQSSLGCARSSRPRSAWSRPT